MKISRQSLKTLLQSKLLIAGLVWIGIFPFIYATLPTRIDLTMDKSLPYWVWLTHEPFEADKNEYAMFHPPVDNQYTHNVKYLVKKVGCSEGQILTSTSTRDFFCDGEYIGTAQQKDKNGKSVDFFQYNGEIPKDNFFMIGTHARSYDSRYFGFVKKDFIERGAVPLW